MAHGYAPPPPLVHPNTFYTLWTYTGRCQANGGGHCTPCPLYLGQQPIHHPLKRASMV